MKRILRTICLALAVLNSIAHATPPSISKTIAVDGVKRHYLVFVPDASPDVRAFPVVFVFHGANNDSSWAEHVPGFSPLAEKKHFIVVYPDGINKRWNPLPVGSPGSKAKPDDVAFVSAIIDDLQAHYRIDPKRIYASGSSNGAIFCHALAARLPNRIAAIGPVSGNLVEGISQSFPPPSPVSVILFNGSDDPLVRYTGEPGRNGMGLLSVPNTIAFWVKVDGCENTPTKATLPRAVPDEGTTVITFTFAKKASTAEVQAYVVEHGGHTWPGVPTDPGWAKIAGKTTMAVNATETMWNFFEAHPKP